MNIESIEIDDVVVCQVVGCQSKAKVDFRLKVGAKRILPLFFVIIANANSLLPVTMTWR
jgi:hypothetical protein